MKVGAASTNIISAPAIGTDNTGKFQSVSAVSGYSGYSGASITGTSGYSGASTSGYSGYSGLLGVLALPATNPSMSGIPIVGTAGESLTHGLLCYMKSDGKYWRTNSTGVATMPGVVMAIGSITGDTTGTFAKLGFVRNDSWTFTPGALLYANGTGGGWGVTAPTGTGTQVQIMGYVESATVIYFRPNLAMVELV